MFTVNPKGSTEETASVSNAGNSRADLIRNLCQVWLTKLVTWAENFTAGRLWVAKSTVLCILFTLVIAGGFGFETFRDGYFDAYYEKIQHPLQDLTLTYPAGSHEAKLNARLTVPVVLHVLGLHARWVLPALTISAVVAILFLSCLLAFQITGNRVVALFVALEVSSTYTGSFGWIMAYDAVALTLVACLLLAQIPWYLRGILVFAAAFTDERGLIASLFVFPFLAAKENTGWRKSINRDNVACAAAVVLYFIARLWLQYGVGMNSTLKGVGPGSFAGNVGYWHAGLWFALEGGWLFVILALLSLLVRKQYVRLVLFLIPTFGLLAGSFMNGDVLRSTAYLFPALFLSLQILREHETDRTLVLYTLVALFASVIAGNYNIYVGKITWFMPVPVYLFNKLCAAVVLWIKAKAGWHD